MKRILIAEDDLDDQLFFSLYLKNRNDITIADMVVNGEELLDFLDNPNKVLPDMIILDQNMPKMNGLQTLEKLKASSQFARIPVMLYSTYVDQELINNGIKFGANIIYTKPQDEEGYNLLINDFLKVSTIENV